MKFVLQLGVVIVISWLGQFIGQLFKLIVPGNIIGMLLLLLLLASGVIKIEMLDKVSKFLLDNLPFFFIPAGVGIIKSLPLLNEIWGSVLVIIFVSTVVTMATTGLTIQLMKNLSAKEKS